MYTDFLAFVKEDGGFNHILTIQYQELGYRRGGLIAYSKEKGWRFEPIEGAFSILLEKIAHLISNLVGVETFRQETNSNYLKQILLEEFKRKPVVLDLIQGEKREFVQLIAEVEGACRDMYSL